MESKIWGLLWNDDGNQTSTCRDILTEAMKDNICKSAK